MKRKDYIMKQFKVYIRSLTKPFRSTAIFYRQWQWNGVEEPDPQRATSVKRAIKVKYIWLSVWKYSVYHREEGGKQCFCTIRGLIRTWKIIFIGSICLEVMWFVLLVFPSVFCIWKTIILVNLNFSLTSELIICN